MHGSNFHKDHSNLQKLYATLSICSLGQSAQFFMDILLTRMTADSETHNLLGLWLVRSKVEACVYVALPFVIVPKPKLRTCVAIFIWVFIAPTYSRRNQVKGILEAATREFETVQKYRRISSTFPATRLIENTISTQTMHRIKETKEFKLLVIEEFKELTRISMCLAYIDSSYTRKIFLIWF